MSPRNILYLCWIIPHKGEYKKSYNHVEAFSSEGKSLGVVFETSSPFETPLAMERLVKFVTEELSKKEIHPLLIIGYFIVEFLAIHPFQDGNGRLSRALTTLLLMQNNYLYVPYSSLESVIESNKESYYLALRKTQATLKTTSKDYSFWLLFFLRSLVKQKNLLEKKVKKEKILQNDISKTASIILSLIKEHGRMKVADLVALSNINRNTIKHYLIGLTKDGRIIRHGKGKGTWYTLY